MKSLDKYKDTNMNNVINACMKKLKKRLSDYGVL